MNRIFTGYIDENECIGDSLGDQTIGGGIKGSINGNFLILDDAIQSLSGTAQGDFSVASNLTVGTDATINNNLTVGNQISAKNDLIVDGTIQVYEKIYVPGPIATGGASTDDILVGGIDYRVHTWISTNTFTVTRAGEIEFLIVAGGGSGGNHSAANANGGGGGGGVLYKSAHYVTPGVYPVVVGAGGAPIAYQTQSVGNSGENSTFLGFIAIGGGGGASTSKNGDYRSQVGGSSGGSSNVYRTASPPLQVDYNGARGYGNSGASGALNYTGGGGGGAGSPAPPVFVPTTTITTDGFPGGDGGRGMPFNITGVQVYYAGGGGGGANVNTNLGGKAGDGWHGGGRGWGRTLYSPNNELVEEVNPVTGGYRTPDAIPNTGGGGGAGSYASGTTGVWANRGSGQGGSGIVIVRYRV